MNTQVHFDITQYKTAESIADRVHMLDMDLAKMQQQIENATIKGDYDRGWMSRLRFAMKARRAERERLLHQLGLFNREVKQSQAQRFERLFMEAAKNVLTQSDYQKVMVETHELVQKGGHE